MISSLPFPKLFEKKPWLVVSLLVLAGFIWVVSNWLTAYLTVQKMNAAVLDSRERFQQIEQQIDNALTVMNRLDLSTDHCSEELLRGVAREVKDSRYIYDSAVRLSNGKMCSSYGHELPAASLPDAGAADYYLRKERSYWFPGVATGPRDRAFITVSSGAAFLWFNVDNFFDAIKIPPPMAYQMIDANGLNAVLADGQPNLILKHPPVIGELTLEGRFWYMAVPSDWPQLLGMISLPSGEYQRARWINFFILMFCAAIVLSMGGMAARQLYRRHFSLGAKLSRAMRNNQLRLNYQPIVEMSTGVWRGAEALLRWSPGGTPMSPAIFIAQAERYGLMHELTRWVCRQAAQDFASWFRDCEGLYITINLSPLDLSNDDFAEYLFVLFSEHGVPPNRIVFELTESSLADTQLAGYRMDQLRQNGHRMAIDDFGTGYSSLAYLEHLPFDILKIDRSFLTLERCHAPDAIWRHVVDLAHAMKLNVVAEGIELPEQAELLLNAGVSLGQGWLYSRDLSAQALATGFFATVPTNRVLQLDSSYGETVAFPDH